MSVKSLFEKIGAGIKKAAVVVSSAFVAVFGEDNAKQFAAAAKNLLMTEAGKIVLDAVELFESIKPGLSGADKHAQAFAKISTDFKSAGITVGESVINMLIELAVQFLKGHFEAVVEGASSPVSSSAPAAPSSTPSSSTPAPASN